MKKFLFRRDVLISTLAVLFIVAGGVAYSIAERTSILSSLYWAVTEATTAGGSYSPSTHPGRVVNVILLLTAAPALAAVFGVMTAQHTAKKVHEKNTRHMAAMEQRLKDHISSEVQNAGQITGTIDQES